MERKKYLVVTAGGSGSRMGGSLPKQFLEIQGKPILRLTIERFLEACPDVQVITVLPASHMGTWREYCVRDSFHCPQHIVAGGFTRFHSVQNALAQVPDGAIVAVHDGVRPFLSAPKIRQLFDLARACPAVIPVMPVTDTLKVLEKKADGTPLPRKWWTAVAFTGPRPRRFSTANCLKRPIPRGLTRSLRTMLP